jgi:lipopolysaccharide/colanic/teichoic acid biosynthesis glycosyltransferase
VPSTGLWLESRAKRGIDIVGSCAALLLALPVLAAVALAVQLQLGTPVMFRQSRAGQHGEPMTVMKFRTMADVRDLNGTLLPDHERLTRFGRWLRGSSLDELPQLWNVVRGEMSLVGPRPLPIAYVDRYTDEQKRRLDAKPGITGWAQVQGRNSLSWPDKLALDVWYVGNASLRVDVRTLALTLKTVLMRGGVSADDHATMHEFMGEAQRPSPPR